VRLFGGLGFERIEGEEVDIAETMQALADLVKAGKIRHIGLSNESAWGVMQHLRVAERLGLPAVVSVQNAYNLLNRTFEIGLSEIAHREGVGLLAYSPLGQGVLTGKYRGGANPPGARKTLFGRMQRYETPIADIAMEKYFDVARRHGVSPTHLALQFVTSRWFVTSKIIGATSLDQLETNLDSIHTPLTEEILRDIEAVHLAHPNPCP
jgi:aryl-alcohol dehydrogenase-like predicted oxidoreductase